jgi:hypothetical protein
MPDNDMHAPGFEIFRELLNHIYRSVMTPGATDTDAQIAAVFTFKTGDPAREKGTDVINHGVDNVMLA